MGKSWKDNKYKQFDGKKKKGHQKNRGKTDRFPNQHQVDDWKKEDFSDKYDPTAIERY